MTEPQTKLGLTAGNGNFPFPLARPKASPVLATTV
jgi:hypothetical protein